MSVGVAVLNLVLGAVYTSYGVITIIDLRRGWAAHGFSHFGAAWIAMAFTCGPHHLDHGLHAIFESRGGTLDLLAVLIGLPAGAVWFALRVEAFGGGLGDRFVAGTPRWLRLLPAVAGIYLVVLMAKGLGVTAGRTPPVQSAPNLVLVVVYMTIGYFLLRSQLRGRPSSGGWSVSGLSLTLVFPTCALMHHVYALYATAGAYHVDSHGLIIDWLAVPAGLYFLWVVRSLYAGAIHDWNDDHAPERPALAAG